MIVHPLRDEPRRVHPLAALGRPQMALPDLTQVHVLAVDDDRDALALESEVLQAAGARVTAAQSGLTALDRLDPRGLMSSSWILACRKWTASSSSLASGGMPIPRSASSRQLRLPRMPGQRIA